MRGDEGKHLFTGKAQRVESCVLCRGRDDRCLYAGWRPQEETLGGGPTMKWGGTMRYGDS